MRALTDKLARVSVDELLDVLNDVPSLGRIDSFSRLLVSRIVSEPDVSAEVRETALVGLIKCISAAPRGSSGSRGSYTRHWPESDHSARWRNRR